MEAKKNKIGKRGGAKRITQKLKQIRRAPISRDIFQIVDDSTERERETPLKKIAGPKIDLEQ